MLMRERPLTRRQKQLLATIQRLSSDRGFPPSLAECADVMLLHRSRCAALARVLEGRGLLAHEPRVARSWRVLHSK